MYMYVSMFDADSYGNRIVCAKKGLNAFCGCMQFEIFLHATELHKKEQLKDFISICRYVVVLKFVTFNLDWFKLGGGISKNNGKEVH